jgi:hypothetical protein
MTDDLVKRLRDIADQFSEIEYACEQAANDRDKFRAALMEIESLAKFYSVRKNTPSYAMRSIACAALAGEKKDG